MRALLFATCLFGLVACSPVDFKDPIEINEGDPFPVEGPIMIDMHMRLGGAPGDRCDAMHGSYKPELRICTILFPG